VSVTASSGRERVLDSVERSSEVLFGLIMVLSFTGSISVATQDREEVREVLVGAIGCNIAWGIVDAVMYLLMIVIERGRDLAIGRAVRESGNAEQCRRRLAETLPDALADLLDDEALERARKRLVAMPALPGRPRLRLRDWQGAVGVFLLVFLSTFPVVLPFVFVSEIHLAMRISNGIAIAMMYVAGHFLGKHAGLRPIPTGLVMVALGVVLVGITIALGG